MSSEWPKTTFDQLCDIKRGASPRPIHDWLAPTGIPWVKISDATASSSPFISKTAEFIRPEGAKKSVEVFPGDFILSNSATPGIPKFMQIHACVHDGWLLLRNFRGLDQWYCYYLLQTERENLIRQGNGSVFTNLKTEILKKHEVVVPPIEYQKQVATFLRTLDDRITLLRETNTTLEAIAQALFKSWFVDFDPVHAKMQGRAPEGMDEATAALFPDSFEDSELGPVPKGWGAGTLADLATFQNGYAFKSKDWTEAGHPVIKIGNVKPGLISFDGCSYVGFESVVGLERFKLGRGDLLVGMTGYVGETGLVTEVLPAAYLNQRVGRIATSEGIKDLGFVFCLTRREDFKAFAEGQSHGSAQANVSGADLLKFKSVIPSHKVLSSFNEVIETLIETFLSNHEQAQVLGVLRDTLLPRLISGQLQLPETTAQLMESLQ